MPRTGFDPGNKSGGDDFRESLLELKELGEKARILILDEGPTYIYRHFIMTPQDERKGLYYACLGDERLLKDRRRDTENCPACRDASSEQDAPVSVARRVFTINVAQYRTNKRGQAETPISMDHKVWRFGEQAYSSLVDMQEEHGDLRRKDVLLTLRNVEFKNMDVSVGGGCAVTTDESGQAKAAVRDLRNGAYAEEQLERIIARRVTFDELDDAVSKSGVAMTDPSWSDSPAPRGGSRQTTASSASELDSPFDGDELDISDVLGLDDDF